MTTTRWNFDPVHSSVNFSVRHLMVSKVHGRFTSWQGSLEFDPDKPAESRVDVTIDAASIETKDEKRDAHLRSPDFFDVEKYPRIHFRSTSVEKAGKDRYRVKGDIEIHGVTKPIELDVEYGGTAKDPWGGERTGFSAHASLNRKDFGLAWNQTLETGGVLVGEKIDINLEIEASKAAKAEAAE